MVGDAIKNHEAFQGTSYSVYAKGSYANNTNVRSDSDVDIVVECQEVRYWKEHDSAAGGHPPEPVYAGDWTPNQLRAEVEAALKGKFEPSTVSKGSAAFTVRSSSARVDADVVPCFTFRYYFENGTYREGTKLFKSEPSLISCRFLSGERIRLCPRNTQMRFVSERFV